VCDVCDVMSENGWNACGVCVVSSREGVDETKGSVARISSRSLSVRSVEVSSRREVEISESRERSGRSS